MGQIISINTHCDHNKLIRYGFKKYGMNYKLFIPLYENHKDTIISAEFLISMESNYAGYDVMDLCSKTIYVPYYNREYSYRNLVADEVTQTLNRILKDMESKKIIEVRQNENS